MTDYLWDYQIESKTFRFTEKSIELNKDHYQLIKAAGFFFYIDKQSDMVIRLEPFKNGSEQVSICVMQKDRTLCHYLHVLDSGLKQKYNYNRLLEQMVFLAQTSFYFLLEKRERQDVIDFLQANVGCSIRLQTINNSAADNPRHEFVSMSIYNYNLPMSKRIDIFLILDTKNDERLLTRDNFINNDLDIVKFISRYSIKRIDHFHNLRKDFHFYEAKLVDEYVGRMTATYDMKKKKATLTSLTYVHGEPVVKKRHVTVESDEHFQMNVLNALARIYLRKYPSEKLVQHFAEWNMDISNGLKEDHLTVLDMFEI